MTNNIFIPNKINVGFQERSDTYTGKLAYIIYFDEKGKLRKEASWNNWRDQSIENKIYDNEPTEGFVLNKNAGGVENSYSYDVRKTYCRIYDPRGFEFEITIPNLLYILQNCTCTKGKGLEGEFVYGWNGKDLLLIPTESPDYKEIQAQSNIIQNNEYIKAKDLIIGATYRTRQGKKYVYLGRFDAWKEETNFYRGNYYSNKIDEGYALPVDDTWHKSKLAFRSYYSYHNKNNLYRYVNSGKEYFFYELESKYICNFKSISRKFISSSTEDMDKFPEYFNILEHCAAYSPYDYSSEQILDLPYDYFEKRLKQGIRNFIIRCEDCLDDIYINCSSLEYYDRSIEKYLKFNSIEELYNKIKPVYGIGYLQNGKLYTKVGYYE